MTAADLTTRQLAERVARAVCDERALGGHVDEECAQVVLDTLRESGHWFCRIEDTPQGHVSVAMPQDVPLPFE